MSNINHGRILQALLIQNTSVNWYQNQMRRVLKEISDIENNVSEQLDVRQLYYQLQGQLFYLMAKAAFERKVLLKIQKEMKEKS